MKIITRKEAIDRGLPRYFTGEQCKHGHIAERNTRKSTCLECKRDWYADNREKVKKQRAAHYQANRKEILERNAKWRDANPDRYAVYQAEYRNTHHDRQRELYQKWEENNREHKNAYQRRWAKENPGRVRARTARYNAANLDRKHEREAAWRKDNPHKLCEWGVAYRKKNPHKVRESVAMRRAVVLRATPPWLTKAHRAEIAEFHKRAVLEGKRTGVPHEVDHRQPLRGKDRCGLHVPWNQQVLTRSENRKKHNR